MSSCLIAFVLLAAPLAAQGTAHYIMTEDGMRLAADVHLPRDLETGVQVPALLELTRYWRSSERPSDGVANPGLRAVERRFLEEGYALVKVDVRGTGASFGTRDAEYGPRDVRDVIAWVARQDWSDGNVGAYGTSYTGTTAELLTATGHPALKAVIPGWSDFDVYESPARPYGLFCAGMIEEWGRMVAAMDRCDASVMGSNVRRVDGDDDGALREAAVAEHAGNLDVGPSVRAAVFRDSPVGGGPPGRSYAKDDAAPLEPGVETEVRIALWPTSVQLAAGHRLRLAIAGADGGTFARVPAEGTPVLEIHHRRGAASFLELPVVRER
ncbi:MAG: CocE/NonD family hydrolase [bacterium]|nr:CocE/NonD family hydrolase [bacterium]